MLKIGFTRNKQAIVLPPVMPGLTGSLHDGDSILLFTCNYDDSGAVITRSKDGNFEDVGTIRMIEPIDHSHVKTIKKNKTYILKGIKSPVGLIDVTFRHVSDFMIDICDN